MRELLCRVWKKDEGFSLIELIIVIAILAIIAAIAVPNLVENLNNSREGVDKATGKMISDAIMQEIALKEYDASTLPATALDFTSQAATPTAADLLELQVIKKLNNGLPDVKRFGSGTYEADITITGTDISVVVSVDSKDDDAAGTTYQVYPSPAGIYND